MLTIGTIFLYGENGVCRVEDIRRETFHGQEREYYVLKPVYNGSSTIHVPVDSPVLKERMRPILTQEEVLELAQCAPQQEAYWISNDAQRGEHFKEILSECNRLEILRMLKSVHLHRRELISNGRHLRAADENVMRRAEKIVREEVALVMDMNPDEVMTYLFENEQRPAATKS